MKEYDPQIHVGIYRKITPTEIKNYFGITVDKFIQMCDEGKFDAYQLDAKTIMINELAIPESFRPKPPPEPTEASIKRQATLDETERNKSEALRIRAEIDLLTVKGERDKPDVLRKKEEALTQRNQELDARVLAIEKKELELKEKEANLKERQIKIDQQDVSSYNLLVSLKPMRCF